jgi:hypothetical protein
MQRVTGLVRAGSSRLDVGYHGILDGSCPDDGESGRKLSVCLGEPFRWRVS